MNIFLLTGKWKNLRHTIESVDSNGCDNIRPEMVGKRDQKWEQFATSIAKWPMNIQQPIRPQKIRDTQHQ